jgi:diaminopimelate epimerase
MKLAFSKMEGAGNDFVFIDDREGALKGREEELALKLCPRRTSVGADGIIFVRTAPAELECDGEMAYYNADGSYSGMCGNGLRCTALFLRDRWGVESADMRIAVDGRPHLVQLHPDEPGSAIVTVELGVPQFEVEDVPALVPGPRHIGKPLQLAEDFAPGCTLLSLGNPHCVMWVEELSDELVRILGPEVERHPLFPERVNAGFAVMRGGAIELRVWERGCGETMACGSGAAAAAVSAVMTGRAELGGSVNVRVPGGDLIVNWQGEGLSALLTGRARFVFDGTVEV